MENISKDKGCPNVNFFVVVESYITDYGAWYGTEFSHC